MSVYGGKVGGKRKDPRGTRKLVNGNGSEAGRNQSMPYRDESISESSGIESHAKEQAHPLLKQDSLILSSDVQPRERPVRFRVFGPLGGSPHRHLAAEVVDGDRPWTTTGEGDVAECLESLELLPERSITSPMSRLEEDSGQSSDVVANSLAECDKPNSVEHSQTISPSGEDGDQGEPIHIAPAGVGVSLPESALHLTSDGMASEPIEAATGPPESETVARSSGLVDFEMLQPTSTGGGAVEARNRWRRVRHTLAFAHHMSHNIRSSSDLLEHGEQERVASDYNGSGDAGRAGAAAFEGARLRGRFRAKGRKGMEGMLVRQDKGIITLVQDFYVACLKMPIAHFLVGVFLAPIALGLLFTPLYLLDKGGLSFDGVTLAEEIVIVGRVAAAKKKVSALVNVFLYALSLSTTFGGSPVAALSPFCLCIANVNTLMGQFLFVFLSGAVFARMSQPSHPIRCSKKAIIRCDDFTSIPTDDLKEKPKVFAVRLVLTGPPPCELVDAKICLTFRIFVKLPSGSMFCSTQDLDLVRPEVSYLRYGIMVRHVIDQKSPVYGHTMESLLDGDASFSLTVMGLERTSMQPIFHLEDYFVSDGDVAWDADYVDFIHINNEGHRVLDHSKIDLIKITQDTKIGGSWKDEQAASEVKRRPEKNEGTDRRATPGVSTEWRSGRGRRKIINSKSTSFTRADW